jgi:hypothetical protein
MTGAESTKISLHNKRIALAVRDAARQAAFRDRVLEEYVAEAPKMRAEMERLKSNGLNPTAWLNAASVPGAFKVNEATASGKLLADVFRQCELDHQNPRHWRILLDALVEQCFRGPGAPQKWDEAGYFELLADIRIVQKLFPTKKTHAELAKVLTSEEPFKSKYERERTNFPGFRKVIGRALNPKINPAVNVPEGADWIAARAERAAQEYGLPTELGIKEQVEALEQLLIDNERQKFFEAHKGDSSDFVEEEWLKRLSVVREFAKLEAKRIREM